MRRTLRTKTRVTAILLALLFSGSAAANDCSDPPSHFRFSCASCPNPGACREKIRALVGRTLKGLRRQRQEASIDPQQTLSHTFRLRRGYCYRVLADAQRAQLRKDVGLKQHWKTRFISKGSSLSQRGGFLWVSDGEFCAKGRGTVTLTIFDKSRYWRRRSAATPRILATGLVRVALYARKHVDRRSPIDRCLECHREYRSCGHGYCRDQFVACCKRNRVNARFCSVPRR